MMAFTVAVTEEREVTQKEALEVVIDAMIRQGPERFGMATWINRAATLFLTDGDRTSMEYSTLVSTLQASPGKVEVLEGSCGSTACMAGTAAIALVAKYGSAPTDTEDLAILLFGEERVAEWYADGIDPFENTSSSWPEVQENVYNVVVDNADDYHLAEWMGALALLRFTLNSLD